MITACQHVSSGDEYDKGSYKCQMTSGSELTVHCYSYHATIGVQKYEWNFGDETPIDRVEDPTHTFPESGTYTVTLKITYNSGRIVTVEDRVIVPKK